MMDAYHRAINQGFSEQEASEIADEAYEQEQYDRANQEQANAAEAEYWYLIEMAEAQKQEEDK